MGDRHLALVSFCHTASCPHFTKEETRRRLRGVTVPDRQAQAPSRHPAEGHPMGTSRGHLPPPPGAASLLDSTRPVSADTRQGSNSAGNWAQAPGGGVLRMAARPPRLTPREGGLPPWTSLSVKPTCSFSGAVTGESSGRPAPKQPGGGQLACGAGVSSGVRGGECWATGRAQGGPGEGSPCWPGFLIYEFWALGTIC